jgi:tRNA 2-thiouridine synthesizing protein E
MPTIEYRGKKIEVDEEGYLVNHKDWNEDVACALAEREGVAQQFPLTTEQLEILRFLRHYYERFGSFPVVRAVCRNVKKPKDCQYEHFPDPIKAWKIAGLPRPPTEVLAYIRHQT